MAKREFKKEMLKGQMGKQVFLREAVNKAIRNLDDEKVKRCASRAIGLIQAASQATLYQ